MYKLYESCVIGYINRITTSEELNLGQQTWIEV